MPVYLSNSTCDSHLSTRKHKSKKKRKCCNCQQTIEKESEYTKTIATYDGYFLSNSWHNECYENHKLYVKEQARKE